MLNFFQILTTICQILMVNEPISVWFDRDWAREVRFYLREWIEQLIVTVGNAIAIENCLRISEIPDGCEGLK